MVLGAEAERGPRRCSPTPSPAGPPGAVRAVVAEDWERGMAASLATGLWCAGPGRPRPRRRGRPARRPARRRGRRGHPRRGRPGARPEPTRQRSCARRTTGSRATRSCSATTTGSASPPQVAARAADRGAGRLRRPALPRRQAGAAGGVRRPGQRARRGPTGGPPVTDPTRTRPAPTSWPSSSAAPATCATTPWRPWGSWPLSSTGRCCSRASPARARPPWPRRWRSRRGVPLIRLQCYEGIDASQALYDWDFPRQILHLRALESEQLRTARSPRSRTRCSPTASCWPGRCCAPCGRARRCCSSTRSTGPTTSSRRSCSRCSRPSR